ncbi:MAG: tRNA uridine(34) 5-carboxymethylaminomethyl modification radical SAM/GNAT enzyme Elp3 [Candidatus Thorarchaeota archaeon]
MNEDIYRELIDKMIEKPPQSAHDLSKMKRDICKKYSLSSFPRNSDILKHTTTEEREIILPFLMKKPSRTLSGVAVVAVMSKPIACPHGKCTMCPGGPEEESPQSYTGYEPAAMRGRMYEYDPEKQVKARIAQLEAIGHNTSKIDLILMGGTLPAAEEQYQESFIKGCLDGITQKDSENIEEAIQFAEKSKRRCIGITVETRPDTCSLERLNKLLNWGITRVELGVQIISDKVYERINRGHSVQDVVNAFKKLRDKGLKITAHMMVGLPGATWEEELASFKTLMNDSRFIPDELKIYPLMLMKNTKLYEEYLDGRYEPLTFEETVKRVAEFKANILPSIRLKRVLRDIPAPRVFAGPKKSDLREYAIKYLEESGRNCRCIRCREVGHKQQKGITPVMKNMEIVRRDYFASEGKEIFLSFEDVEQDIIFGFLRLRHPSKDILIDSLKDSKFSIIRELHIYGSLVGIGNNASSSFDWQHKGLGTKLIEEAVAISRDELGSDLLLVTSGIGVREYYAKRGFEKMLPYMVRKL